MMVGCLHEVLVKRRLHVVKDLIKTTGIDWKSQSCGSRQPTTDLIS